MDIIVSPGNINGVITPPPSKSITQRVYACALLHDGKTIVQNAGSSSDEVAALNLIQSLGAKVDCSEDNLLTIISNGINPIHHEINCKESGLAARLFIPICAIAESSITINGEGSLLKRPMNAHVHTLSELGVKVSSSNGCLPITIAGSIQPENIIVDGSLSSQFLSGLLVAFSFKAEKEVSIKVEDLVSQPYIDLTIQTLSYFDKNVNNDNYELFSILPAETIEGNDIYCHIENDWSAAAALLIAGAITGKVTIDDISVHSMQADKAVLDVLEQTGAKLDKNDHSISIQKTELSPFSFDATNCPDLFPVLSILAATCNGISSIKGVNRLIYKESNRLDSISNMLKEFGVEHQLIDNDLKITGGKDIQTATINCYNDHRIVMAAAIAGLVANGKVTVKGVEAVNKSYPDFFAHLSLLGADIEQV